MTPASAPPVPSLSAFRRYPLGTLVAAGVLLLFCGAYTVQLWSEWKQNPDLSHGFFAPLIFLLLIWESRKQGPQRWLVATPLTTGLLAISLLGGVTIFAITGLFAASLGWSHSLVSFTSGASLCCFLFAGLIVLSNDRVRAVPFNWISLTAIFLWLLVSPLPTGTYSRLTLSLQSWVTTSVLHALHLFGIPARQHGNVIELALTTVGVEEACSGIRSLLSCIYAGFFFAAWQVRRTAGRLVLIVAAPVLALGMNLLRSLLLTLLANDGIDISGTWHDLTGFAILGITALVLAGLAIWLETKSGQPNARTDDVEPLPPTRGPAIAFFTASGLAVALACFYAVNSRPAAHTGVAPPNMAALLPEEATGWSVTTPDNLYQFRDILQTSHLFERTYIRPDGKGGGTQLTVYVAYWEPGQASVSRVASHTPDACWPGAGWIARPLPATDGPLHLPTQEVPAGEHRFFQTVQGYPQNVWFWHIHDGHVINYQDPYSLPALIKIALQYGFRRQGDQVFVRVSSNKSWAELSDDSLVQQIFANITPLGLKSL